MEINSTGITINPHIKNVYGFLILSSCSLLIGTVSKDKKEISLEQKIDNKDYETIIRRSKKKGWCSLIRFYVKRQEELTKYIDKHLEQFFIIDNMLNISGLIIAGQKNPIKRYLTNKNRKLTLNKFIKTIIELDNDGIFGLNEAICKSMINDNL